jgi:uncharacterized protein (TIGR00369 family)
MTPLPEDAGDEYFGIALHRTLGIHVKVGPDHEGIAYIDIDPKVHLGAKWVHGGIFPTLADIASGVAIAMKVPNAMHAIDGTIELKVNYLRKARQGDLTATARIVHRGRRVIVTDVDITNNGVLCGKALGSFMLTAAASAES